MHPDYNAPTYENDLGEILLYFLYFWLILLLNFNFVALIREAAKKKFLH